MSTYAEQVKHKAVCGLLVDQNHVRADMAVAAALPVAVQSMVAVFRRNAHTSNIQLVIQSSATMNIRIARIQTPIWKRHRRRSAGVSPPMGPSFSLTAARAAQPRMKSLELFPLSSMA